MVSTERSQHSTSRIDALPTWQISRVNQRAHRMLVEALAHYGFRGYDYRILTTLEESGPLSQVAIGQRTGIDRSDIVVALRELEARTLIRRMVDTTDRRRNVVAITPWGSAQLTLMDDAMTKVQEMVLAPLSARERTDLLSMLQRLTTAESA